MSATRAMTPAEARAAMTDVMRWTDGKGGWLEVVPLTVTSGGLPCVTTGQQGFAVDPLEIPEITNAMYEAAGTVPPVMLARPDLDSMRSSDGGIRFGDLLLYKTAAGEVAFAVHHVGQTVATFVLLSPAQARQAAAATVALADELPELDPAEIEELAVAIRREIYPDSGKPAEADRIAARTALRWMREREASK